MDRKTLTTAAAIAAIGAAISVTSIVAYSKLATKPQTPLVEHVVCQEQSVQQEEKAVAEPLPSESLRRPMSSHSLSHAPPASNLNVGDENVFTVVLTGGPCGGKTSCLQYVSKRLKEDYGLQVFVAPEMPTLLGSQSECPYPVFGTPTHKLHWESQQMRLKLEFEDCLKRMATTAGADKTIILCDRGLPDTAAYNTDEEFQDILDHNQWTMEHLYARYDMVIHLESAAFDTPYYSTGNNNTRHETCSQAQTQDGKTQTAWAAHNNVMVIRNKDCIIQEDEKDMFVTPKVTAAANPSLDPPVLQLGDSAPALTRANSSVQEEVQHSTFQKKKHLVLKAILGLIGLQPVTSVEPRLYLLEETDKVATTSIEFNMRLLKNMSRLHRLDIKTVFLRGSGDKKEDLVCERRGTPNNWRYYITKAVQSKTSGKMLIERRISGRQYAEYLGREANWNMHTVRRKRMTFVMDLEVTDENDQNQTPLVRSVTHRIDKYTIEEPVKPDNLKKKSDDANDNKAEDSNSKTDDTTDQPATKSLTPHPAQKKGVQTSFVLMSVDVSPSSNYTPPDFLGKYEEVTANSRKYSMKYLARNGNAN